MSQFKVGDWVEHIDLRSTYGSHILRIEEIDTRNAELGFVSLIGQGKILHSNNAQLWTPSIGEWVWWVDSTFGDSITLREFHQEVYDYFKKSTTIEPFIGTLPTWIK